MAKQHGILFAAPMVRAHLADQKTMTRRIAKVDPEDYPVIVGTDDRDGRFNVTFGDAAPTDTIARHEVICPWSVGDFIYVKETFARTANGGDILCRADPMYDGMSKGDIAWNWTPSIFMRKVDSRIWLEVTAIRVERLQDISDADAESEGIWSWTPLHPCGCVEGCSNCDDRTPVEVFRALWESIHGQGAWDRNEWVWVVEFKRIEKP